MHEALGRPCTAETARSWRQAPLSPRMSASRRSPRWSRAPGGRGCRSVPRPIPCSRRAAAGRVPAASRSARCRPAQGAGARAAGPPGRTGAGIRGSRIIVPPGTSLVDLEDRADQGVHGGSSGAGHSATALGTGGPAASSARASSAATASNRRSNRVAASKGRWPLSLAIRSTDACSREIASDQSRGMSGSPEACSVYRASSGERPSRPT